MPLVSLLLLPAMLAADPNQSASPAAKQADPPGLHHLFQVTDRVWSGSQPLGAEGFESLAELDVQVVVSVDGAKPQIAEAKKHGIKYVHIPFGYDSVPDEAQAQLAEVMRRHHGRIYFHCHHGKHRGPAGVAIACLADGSLDAAEAETFMRQVGVSGDYIGLWQSVRKFQPQPSSAPRPTLVEVAQVESLAASMATLDRIYDNLVRIKQAGWKTPAAHPDLSPTAEALLMREGLHEAERLLKQDEYDAKFRQAMKASEAIARTIESKLKENERTGLSDDLAKLKQSCNACHAAYRN
ncbi:MAG: hypothetical protein ACIALR_11610 [Blastopirellula sp. JB062]